MATRRQQEPLGEFFGEFSERLRGDCWQPLLDVFETEKAVVVRVELAGVRREDLRLSVEAETLRIRGVRRPPEHSEELERLHQMEIAFGPFERSVRIAIPFDRDQVSANLEDGYLSVILPKRTARSIEVKR
ncbi:MAG: Hsp20/alpha crystallin family protein [Myxococcota bacterium]